MSLCPKSTSIFWGPRVGFLAGSYEGAYFGVHNRARFCQNAKKTHICIKNREFDEIVVFSAGFENFSVLMRTRIFRFSEKLKKAQIIGF